MRVSICASVIILMHTVDINVTSLTMDSFKVDNSIKTTAILLMRVSICESVIILMHTVDINVTSLTMDSFKVDNSIKDNCYFTDASFYLCECHYSNAHSRY
jgi:uncharacterized membrane protein YwzB